MNSAETTATVECPRCHEQVPIPRDKLTPTFPPMVPNMPPHLLIDYIGHSCDETDVLVNLADAMERR